MTASDHLKHRTGSLGGGQIPEDLRPLHKHSKESLETDPNAYTARLTIALIDRIAKAEAALAQKTRECEELQKRCDTFFRGLEAEEKDCEALHEENDDLKAQVEQLGRQVAEMQEALNIACSDAWPNNPHWPDLYVKRARNNIQSRARTK